jgi:hypothetical protein
MQGRAVLLFVVIAASGAFAGCMSSDPLLRVDAALFAPHISGDVGLANSTVTDISTINLESDLHLGGTDYVPYVGAEVDLASFKFAANYFKTSESGTGTVTADFGAITAGSTVESKLDLALAQGRAVYDLFDNDLFKLGLGVTAEWVNFTLDAREQAFGLTEKIDVNEVVPLLAAHAAVRFDVPFLCPFMLDVNAAGMDAHYQDVGGLVLDVEAMLRAEFKHVDLFTGYRYITVNVDGTTSGQDFKGDVKLAGWMIGLSVRI